jgi:hypothetical protein
MLEQFIIKAHFFINGYSGQYPCFANNLHVGALKRNATQGMIYSDIPAGLVYKRFMLR